MSAGNCRRASSRKRPVTSGKTIATASGITRPGAPLAMTASAVKSQAPRKYSTCLRRSRAYQANKPTVAASQPRPKTKGWAPACKGTWLRQAALPGWPQLPPPEPFMNWSRCGSKPNKSPPVCSVTLRLMRYSA